jgi:hypothetical protein
MVENYKPAFFIQKTKMLFRNFFLAVGSSVVIVFFAFPAFAAMTESATISVSAYVLDANSVIFSGKACPFCQAILLLSGTIKDQDTCDVNSNFQLTSINVPAGNHIFGIYATDSENNQSGISSFSADISQGTLTYFSDIFISPILRVNSEVEKGTDLIISGYTVADANVSIILAGGTEDVLIETIAQSDGTFRHTLITTDMAIGTYSIIARAESEGDLSPYGRLIEFEIKEKIIDDGSTGDSDDEDTNNEGDKIERGTCGEADYDKDGKVDLVDFSILLHWFEKGTTPEKIDLSNDGKVDLVDFSMLMYCWSG